MRKFLSVFMVYLLLFSSVPSTFGQEAPAGETTPQAQEEYSPEQLEDDLDSGKSIDAVLAEHPDALKTLSPTDTSTIDKIDWSKVSAAQFQTAPPAVAAKISPEKLTGSFGKMNDAQRSVLTKDQLSHNILEASGNGGINGLGSYNPEAVQSALGEHIQSNIPGAPTVITVEVADGLTLSEDGKTLKFKTGNFDLTTLNNAGDIVTIKPVGTGVGNVGNGNFLVCASGEGATSQFQCSKIEGAGDFNAKFEEKDGQTQLIVTPKGPNAKPIVIKKGGVFVDASGNVIKLEAGNKIVINGVEVTGIGGKTTVTYEADGFSVKDFAKASMPIRSSGEAVVVEAESFRMKFDGNDEITSLELENGHAFVGPPGQESHIVANNKGDKATILFGQMRGEDGVLLEGNRFNGVKLTGDSYADMFTGNPIAQDYERIRLKANGDSQTFLFEKNSNGILTGQGGDLANINRLNFMITQELQNCATADDPAACRSEVQTKTHSLRDLSIKQDQAYCQSTYSGKTQEACLSRINAQVASGESGAYGGMASVQFSAAQLDKILTEQARRPGETQEQYDERTKTNAFAATTYVSFRLDESGKVKDVGDLSSVGTFALESGKHGTFQSDDQSLGMTLRLQEALLPPKRAQESELDYQERVRLERDLHTRNAVYLAASTVSPTDKFLAKVDYKTPILHNGQPVLLDDKGNAFVKNADGTFSSVTPGVSAHVGTPREPSVVTKFKITDVMKPSDREEREQAIFQELVKSIPKQDSTKNDAEYRRFVQERKEALLAEAKVIVQKESRELKTLVSADSLLATSLYDLETGRLKEGFDHDTTHNLKIFSNNNARRDDGRLIPNVLEVNSDSKNLILGSAVEGSLKKTTGASDVLISGSTIQHNLATIRASREATSQAIGGLKVQIAAELRAQCAETPATQAQCFQDIDKKVNEFLKGSFGIEQNKDGSFTRNGERLDETIKGALFFATEQDKILTFMQNEVITVSTDGTFTETKEDEKVSVSLQGQSRLEQFKTFLQTGKLPGSDQELSADSLEAFKDLNRGAQLSADDRNAEALAQFQSFLDQAAKDNTCLSQGQADCDLNKQSQSLVLGAQLIKGELLSLGGADLREFGEASGLTQGEKETDADFEKRIKQEIVKQTVQDVSTQVDNQDKFAVEVLVGETLLATGDAKKAQEEFAQLKENHPDHATEIDIKIAKSQSAAGDTAGAKKTLGQVFEDLKTCTQNCDALKKQAAETLINDVILKDAKGKDPDTVRAEVNALTDDPAIIAQAEAVIAQQAQFDTLQEQEKALEDAIKLTEQQGKQSSELLSALAANLEEQARKETDSEKKAQLLSEANTLRRQAEEAIFDAAADSNFDIEEGFNFVQTIQQVEQQTQARMSNEQQIAQLSSNPTQSLQNVVSAADALLSVGFRDSISDNTVKLAKATSLRTLAQIEDEPQYTATAKNVFKDVLRVEPTNKQAIVNLAQIAIDECKQGSCSLTDDAAKFLFQTDANGKLTKTQRTDDDGKKLVAVNEGGNDVLTLIGLGLNGKVESFESLSEKSGATADNLARLLEVRAQLKVGEGVIDPKTLDALKKEERSILSIEAQKAFKKVATGSCDKNRDACNALMDEFVQKKCGDDPQCAEKNFAAAKQYASATLVAQDAKAFEQLEKQFGKNAVVNGKKLGDLSTQAKINAIDSARRAGNLDLANELEKEFADTTIPAELSGGACAKGETCTVGKRATYQQKVLEDTLAFANQCDGDCSVEVKGLVTALEYARSEDGQALEVVKLLRDDTDLGKVAQITNFDSEITQAVFGKIISVHKEQKTVVAGDQAIQKISLGSMRADVVESSAQHISTTGVLKDMALTTRTETYQTQMYEEAIKRGASSEEAKAEVEGLRDGFIVTAAERSEEIIIQKKKELESASDGVSATNTRIIRSKGADGGLEERQIVTINEGFEKDFEALHKQGNELVQSNEDLILLAKEMEADPALRERGLQLHAASVADIQDTRSVLVVKAQSFAKAIDPKESAFSTSEDGRRYETAVGTVERIHQEAIVSASILPKEELEFRLNVVASNTDPTHRTVALDLAIAGKLNDMNRQQIVGELSDGTLQSYNAIGMENSLSLEIPASERDAVINRLANAAKDRFVDSAVHGHIAPEGFDGSSSAMTVEEFVNYCKGIESEALCNNPSISSTGKAIGPNLQDSMIQIAAKRSALDENFKQAITQETQGGVLSNEEALSNALTASKKSQEMQTLDGVILRLTLEEEERQRRAGVATDPEDIKRSVQQKLSLAGIEQERIRQEQIYREHNGIPEGFPLSEKDKSEIEARAVVRTQELNAQDRDPTLFLAQDELLRAKKQQEALNVEGAREAAIASLPPQLRAQIDDNPFAKGAGRDILLSQINPQEITDPVARAALTEFLDAKSQSIALNDEVLRREKEVRIATTVLSELAGNAALESYYDYHSQGILHLSDAELEKQVKQKEDLFRLAASMPPGAQLTQKQQQDIRAGVIADNTYARTAGFDRSQVMSSIDSRGSYLDKVIQSGDLASISDPALRAFVSNTVYLDAADTSQDAAKALQEQHTGYLGDTFKRSRSLYTAIRLPEFLRSSDEIFDNTNEAHAKAYSTELAIRQMQSLGLDPYSLKSQTDAELYESIRRSKELSGEPFTEQDIQDNVDFLKERRLEMAGVGGLQTKTSDIVDQDLLDFHHSKETKLADELLAADQIAITIISAGAASAIASKAVAGLAAAARVSATAVNAGRAATFARNVGYAADLAAGGQRAAALTQVSRAASITHRTASMLITGYVMPDTANFAAASLDILRDCHGQDCNKFTSPTEITAIDRTTSVAAMLGEAAFGAATSRIAGAAAARTAATRAGAQIARQRAAQSFSSGFRNYAAESLGEGLTEYGTQSLEVYLHRAGVCDSCQSEREHFALIAARSATMVAGVQLGQGGAAKIRNSASKTVQNVRDASLRYSNRPDIVNPKVESVLPTGTVAPENLPDSFVDSFVQQNIPTLEAQLKAQGTPVTAANLNDAARTQLSTLSSPDLVSTIQNTPGVNPANVLTDVLVASNTRLGLQMSTEQAQAHAQRLAQDTAIASTLKAKDKREAAQAELDQEQERFVQVAIEAKTDEEIAQAQQQLGTKERSFLDAQSAELTARKNAGESVSDIEVLQIENKRLALQRNDANRLFEQTTLEILSNADEEKKQEIARQQERFQELLIQIREQEVKVHEQLDTVFLASKDPVIKEIAEISTIQTKIERLTLENTKDRLKGASDAQERILQRNLEINDLQRQANAQNLGLVTASVIETRQDNLVRLEQENAQLREQITQLTQLSQQIQSVEDQINLAKVDDLDTKGLEQQKAALESIVQKDSPTQDTQDVLFERIVSLEQESSLIVTRLETVKKNVQSPLSQEELTDLELELDKQKKILEAQRDVLIVQKQTIENNKKIAQATENNNPTAELQKEATRIAQQQATATSELLALEGVTLDSAIVPPAATPVQEPSKTPTTKDLLPGLESILVVHQDGTERIKERFTDDALAAKTLDKRFEPLIQVAPKLRTLFDQPPAKEIREKEFQEIRKNLPQEQHAMLDHFENYVDARAEYFAKQQQIELESDIAQESLEQATPREKADKRIALGEESNSVREVLAFREAKRISENPQEAQAQREGRVKRLTETKAFALSSLESGDMVLQIGRENLKSLNDETTQAFTDGVMAFERAQLKRLLEQYGMNILYSQFNVEAIVLKGGKIKVTEANKAALSQVLGRPVEADITLSEQDATLILKDIAAKLENAVQQHVKELAPKTKKMGLSELTPTITRSFGVATVQTSGVSADFKASAAMALQKAQLARGEERNALFDEAGSKAALTRALRELMPTLEKTGMATEGLLKKDVAEKVRKYNELSEADKVKYAKAKEYFDNIRLLDYFQGVSTNQAQAQALRQRIITLQSKIQQLKSKEDTTLAKEVDEELVKLLSLSEKNDALASRGAFLEGAVLPYGDATPFGESRAIAFADFRGFAVENFRDLELSARKIVDGTLSFDEHAQQALRNVDGRIEKIQNDVKRRYIELVRRSGLSEKAKEFEIANAGRIFTPGGDEIIATVPESLLPEVVKIVREESNRERDGQPGFRVRVGVEFYVTGSVESALRALEGADRATQLGKALEASNIDADHTERLASGDLAAFKNGKILSLDTSGDKIIPGDGTPNIVRFDALTKKFVPSQLVGDAQRQMESGRILEAERTIQEVLDVARNVVDTTDADLLSQPIASIGRTRRIIDILRKSMEQTDRPDDLALLEKVSIRLAAIEKVLDAQLKLKRLEIPVPDFSGEIKQAEDFLEESLGAPLGQGTSGEVFAIEVDGKQMAFKRFKQAEEAPEQLTARIQKEFFLAQQASDLDVGVEVDELRADGFTMELIPGISSKEFSKNPEKVRQLFTRRSLLQLEKHLATLKQAGLGMTDIQFMLIDKPVVLNGKQRQPGDVVLMDFETLKSLSEFTTGQKDQMTRSVQSFAKFIPSPSFDGVEMTDLLNQEQDPQIRKFRDQLQEGFNAAAYAGLLRFVQSKDIIELGIERKEQLLLEVEMLAEQGRRTDAFRKEMGIPKRTSLVEFYEGLDQEGKRRFNKQFTKLIGKEFKQSLLEEDAELLAEKSILIDVQAELAQLDKDIEDIAVKMAATVDSANAFEKIALDSGTSVQETAKAVNSIFELFFTEAGVTPSEALLETIKEAREQAQVKTQKVFDVFFDEAGVTPKEALSQSSQEALRQIMQQRLLSNILGGIISDGDVQVYLLTVQETGSLSVSTRPDSPFFMIEQMLLPLSLSRESMQTLLAEPLFAQELYEQVHADKDQLAQRKAARVFTSLLQEAGFFLDAPAKEQIQQGFKTPKAQKIIAEVVQATASLVPEVNEVFESPQILLVEATESLIPEMDSLLEEVITEVGPIEISLPSTASKQVVTALAQQEIEVQHALKKKEAAEFTDGVRDRIINGVVKGEFTTQDLERFISTINQGKISDITSDSSLSRIYEKFNEQLMSLPRESRESIGSLPLMVESLRSASEVLITFEGKITPENVFELQQRYYVQLNDALDRGDISTDDLKQKALALKGLKTSVDNPVIDRTLRNVEATLRQDLASAALGPLSVKQEVLLKVLEEMVSGPLRDIPTLQLERANIVQKVTEERKEELFARVVGAESTSYAHVLKQTLHELTTGRFTPLELYEAYHDSSKLPEGLENTAVQRKAIEQILALWNIPLEMDALSLEGLKIFGTQKSHFFDAALPKEAFSAELSSTLLAGLLSGEYTHAEMIASQAYFTDASIALPQTLRDRLDELYPDLSSDDLKDAIAKTYTFFGEIPQSLASLSAPLEESGTSSTEESTEPGLKRPVEISEVDEADIFEVISVNNPSTGIEIDSQEGYEIVQEEFDARSGETAIEGVASDGSTIDVSSLKGKAPPILEDIVLDGVMPVYGLKDLATLDLPDTTKKTLEAIIKSKNSLLANLHRDTPGLLEQLVNGELLDGDRRYTVLDINGEKVAALLRPVFGKDYFSTINTRIRELDTSEFREPSDTLKNGARYLQLRRTKDTDQKLGSDEVKELEGYESKDSFLSESTLNELTRKYGSYLEYSKLVGFRDGGLRDFQDNGVRSTVSSLEINNVGKAFSSTQGSVASVVGLKAPSSTLTRINGKSVEASLLVPGLVDLGKSSRADNVDSQVKSIISAAESAAAARLERLEGTSIPRIEGKLSFADAAQKSRHSKLVAEYVQSIKATMVLAMMNGVAIRQTDLNLFLRVEGEKVDVYVVDNEFGYAATNGLRRATYFFNAPNNVITTFLFDKFSVDGKITTLEQELDAEVAFRHNEHPGSLMLDRKFTPLGETVLKNAADAVMAAQRVDVTEAFSVSDYSGYDLESRVTEFSKVRANIPLIKEEFMILAQLGGPAYEYKGRLAKVTFEQGVAKEVVSFKSFEASQQLKDLRKEHPELARDILVFENLLLKDKEPTPLKQKTLARSANEDLAFIFMLGLRAKFDGDFATAESYFTRAKSQAPAPIGDILQRHLTDMGFEDLVVSQVPTFVDGKPVRSFAFENGALLEVTRIPVGKTKVSVPVRSIDDVVASGVIPLQKVFFQKIGEFFVPPKEIIDVYLPNEMVVDGKAQQKSLPVSNKALTTSTLEDIVSQNEAPAVQDIPIHRRLMAKALTEKIGIQILEQQVQRVFDVQTNALVSATEIAAFVDEVRPGLSEVARQHILDGINSVGTAYAQLFPALSASEYQVVDFIGEKSFNADSHSALRSPMGALVVKERSSGKEFVVKGDYTFETLANAAKEFGFSPIIQGRFNLASPITQSKIIPLDSSKRHRSSARLANEVLKRLSEKLKTDLGEVPVGFTKAVGGTDVEFSPFIQNDGTLKKALQDNKEFTEKQKLQFMIHKYLVLLVGNTDANNANFLIGKDGNIYAIDQARAFDDAYFEIGAKSSTYPDLLPGSLFAGLPNFAKNRALIEEVINSLTEQELREIFSQEYDPVMTEQLTRFVIKQQKDVRSHFDFAQENEKMRAVTFDGQSIIENHLVEKYNEGLTLDNRILNTFLSIPADATADQLAEAMKNVLTEFALLSQGERDAIKENLVRTMTEQGHPDTLTLQDMLEKVESASLRPSNSVQGIPVRFLQASGVLPAIEAAKLQPVLDLATLLAQGFARGESLDTALKEFAALDAIERQAVREQALQKMQALHPGKALGLQNTLEQVVKEQSPPEANIHDIPTMLGRRMAQVLVQKDQNDEEFRKMLETYLSLDPQLRQAVQQSAFDHIGELENGESDRLTLEEQFLQADKKLEVLSLAENLENTAPGILRAKMRAQLEQENGPGKSPCTDCSIDKTALAKLADELRMVSHTPFEGAILLGNNQYVTRDDFERVRSIHAQTWAVQVFQFLEHAGTLNNEQATLFTHTQALIEKAKKDGEIDTDFERFVVSYAKVAMAARQGNIKEAIQLLDEQAIPATNIPGYESWRANLDLWKSNLQRFGTDRDAFYKEVIASYNTPQGAIAMDALVDILRGFSPEVRQDAIQQIYDIALKNIAEYGHNPLDIEETLTTKLQERLSLPPPQVHVENKAVRFAFEDGRLVMVHADIALGIRDDEVTFRVYVRDLKTVLAEGILDFENDAIDVSFSENPGVMERVKRAFENLGKEKTKAGHLEITVPRDMFRNGKPTLSALNLDALKPIDTLQHVDPQRLNDEIAALFDAGLENTPAFTGLMQVFRTLRQKDRQYIIDSMEDIELRQRLGEESVKAQQELLLPNKRLQAEVERQLQGISPCSVCVLLDKEYMLHVAKKRGMHIENTGEVEITKDNFVSQEDATILTGIASTAWALRIFKEMKNAGTPGNPQDILFKHARSVIVNALTTGKVDTQFEHFFVGYAKAYLSIKEGNIEEAIKVIDTEVITNVPKGWESHVSEWRQSLSGITDFAQMRTLLVDTNNLLSQFNQDPIGTAASTDAQSLLLSGAGIEEILSATTTELANQLLNQGLLDDLTDIKDGKPPRSGRMPQADYLQGKLAIILEDKSAFRISAIRDDQGKLVLFRYAKNNRYLKSDPSSIDTLIDSITDPSQLSELEKAALEPAFADVQGIPRGISDASVLRLYQRCNTCFEDDGKHLVIKNGMGWRIKKGMELQTANPPEGVDGSGYVHLLEHKDDFNGFFTSENTGLSGSYAGGIDSVLLAKPETSFVYSTKGGGTGEIFRLDDDVLAFRLRGTHIDSQVDTLYASTEALSLEFAKEEKSVLRLFNTAVYDAVWENSDGTELIMVFGDRQIRYTLKDGDKGKILHVIAEKVNVPTTFKPSKMKEDKTSNRPASITSKAKAGATFDLKFILGEKALASELHS